MSIIWQKGVNTGNLTGTGEDEFSAQVGTACSCTAAAALGGSAYGVAVDMNGTTASYVYPAIESHTSGTVSARFLWNPNGVTWTGDNDVSIFYLRYSTTDYNLAAIWVFYDQSADRYYIYGKLYDDLIVDHSSTLIGPFLTSGTHSIEVKIVRATGPGANDGYMDIMVDGPTIDASINGVDNDTLMAQWNAVRLGRITNGAATIGSIYLDELIVRDDDTFIGSSSVSASPSPSAEVTGSVCWGHATGVTEDNIRGFAGNWAGTGSVEDSGDSESLALAEGQFMVSEVIATGAIRVQLLQNQYTAGDNATLYYRTAATESDCLIADWQLYTDKFTSLGHVQVKALGGDAPLIDYDFDSGSLGSFTVVDETPTIRLVPNHYWGGYWSWYAIRSDAWSGQTPHFLINKTDAWGSAPTAGAVIATWATAADTDTWNNFDNQNVVGDDVEFYHNSAFPSGMIYIAYWPLYDFNRSKRKIAEWAEDTRIIDTTSSSNLILNNMYPRVNSDGRPVPGLPLYAFQLTNASGYTKNTLVIATGNHPSETPGRFQFEGAMDFLLGGTAEAELLLDWFNIYVYPCLNPQGIFGGYFRSCPQKATQDHNRVWDVGGLEDVNSFKTAFVADFGGDADAFIDYHAALGNTEGYMSSEDHTAEPWASYLAWAKRVQPSYYSYLDETIPTGLGYLFQHTYGAILSLASESGYIAAHSPATMKEQGKNSIKTLAHLLAAGTFTNYPADLGSRVFNGTTDRIDFASAASLGGHAITISLWVKTDGYPASGNGYLITLNNPTNTSYGVVVTHSDATNKYVSFLANGTSAMNHYVSGVTLNDAWHHLLFTFPGDNTNAASVNTYVDGTLKSGSNTNGSGTPIATTGTWSIGARTWDDTRCTDGMVAQVRVFDRVLDASEIALESQGVVTTTSGLVFYFKGNTTSLDADPGGTGTADGTTHTTGIGNGPAIIYP